MAHYVFNINRKVVLYMKVKDLFSVMLDCEIVTIKHDNVRIFSGTVEDLKRQGKHLDMDIVAMHIEMDSVILNTRQPSKDSLIVKKVKKEMIRNAIGLSDIGFMTYLNYLNITISMLYSFEVISKNEYDDLLKYLSNVDWYRVCKKEVYI